MFPDFQNVQRFLTESQIKCRPQTGPGLWLMFLLPVAIITSAITQPVITSSTYKSSAIFSIGLICSSLLFIYKNCGYKDQKLFNIWLIAGNVAITALYQVCLHKGLLFSVWSAVSSVVLYNQLHLFCLKKLPYCFSLGEAALCSQSYILLIYCTSINIYNHIAQPATSVMQISTFILQVGFFGLTTIIFITYQFSITSPTVFYLLVIFIFTFVILLPGQILLKQNPVLWIIDLLWDDLQRNRIVVYWALCSILTVAVINKQIKSGRKASTSVRKVFHVFTVVVFLPGLLYNCSLLYLASGIVLAIFFMLEVLRVLNIPPIGQHLQNGIVIYGDEKDKGIIAFTPMYLLCGCALPLWLHPAPCDLTDSAALNLLPLISGLLTVGIGDTVASVIGSNFGKHHWSDSKKTVEGTVAGVLSQLGVIFALVYLDFVKLFTVVEGVKISLAVIVTSILEARTDQVDNVVLPFVMYVIFMF